MTTERSESRPPVTVLGLGAMGRALAGAFLAAGHPTTVWNRTPSRADELVARGARRAHTPAEAVATNPLTVVCVIDYAAVHAIVDPAAEALKGRALVNLTADTPERARRMAVWADERGIDYLDGAIMTPAPTIGGPAASVLYSGPQRVYDTHRPALESLGGTATYLGAHPGRAAAHDVALVDLFWTAVSGVTHAFALAEAEGVAPTDLAPFAQRIGGLLTDLVPRLAHQIAEDRHPGAVATIESAAAGMDHVIHTTEAHGIDTGVLVAARTIALRAIDAGHGSDGLSRLTATLRGGQTTG